MLHTYSHNFPAATRIRPETPAEPDEIPGRDSYIVAEAFLHFVAYQQQLPTEEMSWSNTRDAIAILQVLCTGDAAIFAKRYPNLVVDLTYLK